MDNKNLFTTDNLLKILRTLFSVVIILNLIFVTVSCFKVDKIWISLTQPLLWVCIASTLLLLSLFIANKLMKRMLIKASYLENDTGRFSGVLISYTLLIGIIQGPILLSTILFLLFGNLIFGLCSLVGLFILYCKIPKEAELIRLLES